MQDDKLYEKYYDILSPLLIGCNFGYHHVQYWTEKFEE